MAVSPCPASARGCLSAVVKPILLLPSVFHTHPPAPLTLIPTIEWATVRIQCWGYINASVPQPKGLHTADIPIRDHGWCARKYEQISRTITSSMICAGGPKDSCNGDGGGPLTRLKSLKHGQRQRYICSIASWGVNCRGADLPGCLH